GRSVLAHTKPTKITKKPADRDGDWPKCTLRDWRVRGNPVGHDHAIHSPATEPKAGHCAVPPPRPAFTGVMPGMSARCATRLAGRILRDLRGLCVKQGAAKPTRQLLWTVRFGSHKAHEDHEGTGGQGRGPAQMRLDNWRGHRSIGPSTNFGLNAENAPSAKQSGALQKAQFSAKRKRGRSSRPRSCVSRRKDQALLAMISSAMFRGTGS